MLVSRSQSSQSSTSLRARRLPVPGTLGSFRLGPTVRDRLAPGRRVSLDRLQPIIDKLDGAADLGLREWHVKEPLDFLRDFRL